MTRKFISALGTGKYSGCFYDINGNKHYTSYIQEALIKEFCADWGEKDEIVILLTDQAKAINWFSESDEQKRLKSRIEKIGLKARVKELHINEGKSENEIWDNFDIIYNCLDEEDEVIFDLTHSFRSIPMYVLVVLNYAKILKNIKVGGIYYGAYEARKNIDGKEVAPVFNLTSFNELLEWTSAVNTFVNYGVSQPIYNLFEDIKMSKNRAKDRSYNKFEGTIGSLNNFSRDILICAGKHIKDDVSDNKKQMKSISVAAKTFKNNYDRLSNNNDLDIKPLKPLFQKLEQAVNPFCTEDNLKIGMATVQWSIKNNLLQQGFTALDETIKTYVCRLYELDDTDYEQREGIVASAIRILAQKIDESNWRIKKEEYRPVIKNIVNTLDFEVAQLADRVSQDRNMINHFFFTDVPKGYEALKEDLIECYKVLSGFIEVLIEDNGGVIK